MTDTIRVTDLDFLTIKENLKTWMRNSSSFTDYDFEASGLSALLDVMAYNTHYNAVLANFSANEMFLDTAVKRNSVISHAKSLGYHPRGYSSARIKIDLTIKSLYISPGFTAPDTFVIRRGTQFTTSIDGAFYSFVLISDASAIKNGSTYEFYDLELVEGLFNTFSWVVPNELYNNMYTIPNPRVDISTIKLQSFPNSNSFNATDWYHSTTLFDIDDTSKVFFTQETFGDKTDIYFGDGIIGSKPSTNNIIRIEYVTTNGSSGNGAKVFNVSGALRHNNQEEIYAQSYSINLSAGSDGSANGSNSESIDEIKFHASKHFTVQNRAVTPYDYMSIIRENFANVEAIRVWGGEDNIPPQYNSVMVCIKPNTSDYLTESEKSYIRTLLKNSSVMNIRPLFVDPEYLDIDITSTIKFDPSKISQSTDLKSIIINSLLVYSDVFLEKFNADLLYSNLSTAIDNSSIGILSNLTTLRMKKLLYPSLGIPKTYIVNFSNSLSQETGVIISSTFKTTDSDQTLFFKNIGDNIVLGYNNGTSFIRVKTIGTIDYNQGSISLNSLNVTNVTDGVITVTSLPLVQDIHSQLNNILRIQPSYITLTLVPDTSTTVRVIATS